MGRLCGIRNRIVFGEVVVVLLVEAGFVIVLVGFRRRRAADELDAAEYGQAAPVQGHDRTAEAHAFVRTLGRGELLPFLRAEAFARADDAIDRAIGGWQLDLFTFAVHVQTAVGLDDLLGAAALLAAMDVVTVLVDG